MQCCRFVPGKLEIILEFLYLTGDIISRVSPRTACGAIWQSHHNGAIPSRRGEQCQGIPCFAPSALRGPEISTFLPPFCLPSSLRFSRWIFMKLVNSETTEPRNKRNFFLGTTEQVSQVKNKKKREPWSLHSRSGSAKPGANENKFILCYSGGYVPHMGHQIVHRGEKDSVRVQRESIHLDGHLQRISTVSLPQRLDVSASKKTIFLATCYTDPTRW